MQMVMNIDHGHHPVARLGQRLGDARLVLVLFFLNAQEGGDLGQAVLHPVIDFLAQRVIAFQQRIGLVQDLLQGQLGALLDPHALAQFDLAHHQLGHHLQKVALLLGQFARLGVQHAQHPQWIPSSLVSAAPA